MNAQQAYTLPAKNYYKYCYLIGAKDKPLMLSVEVQTQTCDFIDLTAANSPQESGRSQVDRKEKRY